LCLLALAACGGQAQQAPSRPTAVPTPTLTAGQQLLKKVATTLNSAKTLHGTLNFEVWNAAPDKDRSVVLQSSVAEIPVGTLNVSDGKRIWQYDPGKK